MIDIESRPDFWLVVAPAVGTDAFCDKVRASVRKGLRETTAQHWPKERYREPVLRWVDPSDRALFGAAISSALRHAAAKEGSAVLVDGQQGIIAAGKSQRQVHVRLLRLMLD